MGQKEFTGHIFLHRFPRDAFPGRSGHTVFPGISSGGSILSSGFPFFFFLGACRRGRHRVGSGLPVPEQRKSGNTLAFFPHALLQPEYFRQTGKSPGTACSPLRAPCAQGSGTFCAMDTGSRPVDNSPCRYIQFRGTKSPV